MEDYVCEKCGHISKHLKKKVEMSGREYQDLMRDNQEQNKGFTN